MSRRERTNRAATRRKTRTTNKPSASLWCRYCTLSRASRLGDSAHPSLAIQGGPMNTRKTMRPLVPALLGLSLAVLGVTVQAGPPFTVVADGLANPRGITFAPGGRLYVAQAGTGDHTGKISEIRDPTSTSPTLRDVVTGLLSIAGENPGEFVGVDGLSALGNG